MTNILKSTLIGVSFICLAACTTTGNVERGAVGGAAAGAAVGAGVGAISGDVKVGEGAAVGAAAGAIIGGIRGNKRDKQMVGGTSAAPILDRSTQYYDENTGRYYFYEKGTSRTFYANGEQRS